MSIQMPSKFAEGSKGLVIEDQGIQSMFLHRIQDRLLPCLFANSATLNLTH